MAYRVVGCGHILGMNMIDHFIHSDRYVFNETCALRTVLG